MYSINPYKFIQLSSLITIISLCDLYHRTYKSLNLFLHRIDYKQQMPIIMRTKFLIPAITLLFASYSTVFADDGATMFRTNCGACHSIGKGKLVGPDLKDVDTRHSEAWILKWVKSSQSLVSAGDKDAVKLFADNSSIPMPDQPLNDDQIKSILGFIKAGGVDAVSASVSTAPAVGQDNVAIATQKAAEEQKSEGSLLTMFSFTEYILMFLAGIMLLIIYVMGMAIKTLTEKVKQVEAPATV